VRRATYHLPPTLRGQKCIHTRFDTLSICTLYPCISSLPPIRICCSASLSHYYPANPVFHPADSTIASNATRYCHAVHLPSCHPSSVFPQMFWLEHRKTVHRRTGIYLPFPPKRAALLRKPHKMGNIVCIVVNYMPFQCIMIQS
jgi:hypothetical protein